VCGRGGGGRGGGQRGGAVQQERRQVVWGRGRWHGSAVKCTTRTLLYAPRNVTEVLETKAVSALIAMPARPCRAPRLRAFLSRERGNGIAATALQESLKRRAPGARRRRRPLSSLGEVLRRSEMVRLFALPRRTKWRCLRAARCAQQAATIPSLLSQAPPRLRRLR